MMGTGYFCSLSFRFVVSDMHITSPLEETLLDFSMYEFCISLPYEVGSPLGPLVILNSQKDRGLEE